MTINKLFCKQHNLTVNRISWLQDAWPDEVFKYIERDIERVKQMRPAELGTAIGCSFGREKVVGALRAREDFKVREAHQ